MKTTHTYTSLGHPSWFEHTFSDAFNLCTDMQADMKRKEDRHIHGLSNSERGRWTGRKTDKSADMDTVP